MFTTRKKKQQDILRNYKKTKRSAFDFDRIKKYFSATDKSEAHQVISNSTLQDLDFEELFMYLRSYMFQNRPTVPLLHSKNHSKRSKAAFAIRENYKPSQ